MASVFIALHHNATLPVEVMPGQMVDVTFYTAGIKVRKKKIFFLKIRMRDKPHLFLFHQDIPATFFYLLIAIVMHQIVQEYFLDKINRKLHLSKIKHSKFNDSGQLLSFYLVSILWAGDILLRENLFNIRLLWEGYPHVHMNFMFKFFYIVQIAYWLHTYPELYFQKVRNKSNIFYCLGEESFIFSFQML